MPDHWNLNCSCFPQGALQHRRAGMQTAASQGIEQTRARSGSKDHSARRTQGADAKSRHDENALSHLARGRRSGDKQELQRAAQLQTEAHAQSCSTIAQSRTEASRKNAGAAAELAKTCVQQAGRHKQLQTERTRPGKT